MISLSISGSSVSDSTTSVMLRLWSRLSITPMSPNCRSRSTRATRDSVSTASATDRLVASSVLPTPPLPENSTITSPSAAARGAPDAVRGGRPRERALLLLELVDAADRGDQLVVAERLDQVLARPGLHRAAEVVALALDRHDDHRRGGQLLSEPLGELDPVHDRHVHVGEHDVRQQPVRLLEALLAIAGGADDLDVLFEPEQLAQVVPSARDVVDDEEPDQIEGDLSPPSVVLPAPGRPGCRGPWSRRR